MGNDSFISKLLQGVAAVFTLAGIISQYLLRKEFFQILKIDNTNSLYDSFTLAGLIIGLIIFVGIFANRYLINNKIYLDKKAYEKYLNLIRENQPKTEDKRLNIVEPFNFSVSNIAWVLLIFSVVFFILIPVIQNPLSKGIFYLLFLLAAIFSSTVFLLQLYLDEDWKKREKERRDSFHEKIKSRLSPSFKILNILENNSNFMYPVTTMTIEMSGKKYQINADSNNPDKFFNLIEIQDDIEEAKKVKDAPKT